MVEVSHGEVLTNRSFLVANLVYRVRSLMVVRMAERKRKMELVRTVPMAS